MTTIIALPYASARAERVTLHPWRLRLQGVESEWHTDPALLEGWDQQAAIEIHREIDVDWGLVRRDCELGEDAQLLLIAVLRSRSTFWRQLVAVPAEKADPNKHVLRLTQEGAALAGELELSMRLVVQDAGSSPSPLAASIAGAVIWEEQPRRVILEGAGGLFPTEVTPFRNWPHLEAPDAPWHLEFDADSPGEDLLSGDCGLRLYINADHREHDEMLRRDGPWVERLRSDVGRRLVTTALQSQTFVREAERGAENSVGRCVLALIDLVFPGEGLDKLAADYQANPGRVETRIHSYFESEAQHD